MGNGGVLHTASKVRTKVWVVHLLKLVKFILKNCTSCIIFNKTRAVQLMGAQTDGRTQLSYPFARNCVDLFGPYEVEDFFRKITVKKVYAAIFTCLFSRAVYLDIILSYSTENFLQTSRRVVTIRGYPRFFIQILGHNWLVQAGNSKVFTEFSIVIFCQKNCFLRELDENLLQALHLGVMHVQSH